DGTETIDQPAHTQHARIVRTDRDEVEVILVERALEIVFPSPVQDSLVNAAHVCPEGGCVIDHWRGTQFLPHLLYGLTSSRGEQACGSAGLVQIPYNWRMSAGRRAAQWLILARGNVPPLARAGIGPIPDGRLRRRDREVHCPVQPA